MSLCNHLIKFDRVWRLGFLPTEPITGGNITQQSQSSPFGILYQLWLTVQVVEAKPRCVLINGDPHPNAPRAYSPLENRWGKCMFRRLTLACLVLVHERREVFTPVLIKHVNRR